MSSADSRDSVPLFVSIYSETDADISVEATYRS